MRSLEEAGTTDRRESLGHVVLRYVEGRSYASTRYGVEEDAVVARRQQRDQISCPLAECLGSSAYGRDSEMVSCIGQSGIYVQGVSNLG